jgi:hypothetical protein
MSKKVLKIKTTGGVLRRCGIDFYEEPREISISHLKPHQIESLKADQLLVVEEVEEKKPLPQGKYEQEGYV